MVKLNSRKIGWIVRHVVDVRDVSTRKAAEIYGISVRRVQQLVRCYKSTGVSILFLV
jgi:transposase